MSASLTTTIPAWGTMLLAAPVGWCGERWMRRSGLLARCAIPGPIVTGLIVAVGLLAAGAAGAPVRLELATAHPAWTWLVTAEPDWLARPERAVHLPLLAVFFAGVGLGASWAGLRRAGRPLLVFVAVVSVLAALQNLVGVGAARLVGADPLLGLICGSMSLTGGHATTLGFAGEFERAGFAGARTFGAAAATFGLVAGALLSGPLGRALIRRHGLRPGGAADVEPRPDVAGGARPQLRRSWGAPAHLLLLAATLKAGAWLSYLFQRAGLVLPVFVGTLFAGLLLRHLLESFRPGAFDATFVESLASVALGWFLAAAMMTLDLGELAGAAGPMVFILGLQVVLMLGFAWVVTFRLLGRDHESAVMAAGHVGFGLGSTATAVAGMKALVAACGPAPRAFLIVPLAGGFLVDLTNAALLTLSLALLR